MSDHKISWLNQPGFKGETWNFITGCTPVQSGCKNCWAQYYAATRGRKQRRYKGLTKNGKWTGEVQFHTDLLDQPLHWRKPRCIFVVSMGDLFHPKISEQAIAAVLETICNPSCDKHRFIMLTKRPSRLARFYSGANIWHYYSASTQVELDAGLSYLLKSGVAIRGLSLEPLLGPIKLPKPCPRLNHVIIGGESGPGWRNMRIDSLESLVNDCRKLQIPVYVKQDSGPVAGNRGRIPDWLWIQELPASI